MFVDWDSLFTLMTLKVTDRGRSCNLWPRPTTTENELLESKWCRMVYVWYSYHLTRVSYYQMVGLVYSGSGTTWFHSFISWSNNDVALYEPAVVAVAPLRTNVVETTRQEMGEVIAQPKRRSIWQPLNHFWNSPRNASETRVCICRFNVVGFQDLPSILLWPI